VRARLSSLSPRALAGLLGAVVFLYAAVLWLLVVSPSRSDAAAAKDELAAAEVRLAAAQTTTTRPRAVDAPVVDVLRLTKAMPASSDQSGLVLELTRLARVSGVKLKFLTQQELVEAVGGPSMIPISVTVGGNYRQITRFLRLTRTLVTVRGGAIRARGRLLGVQGVTLTESASEGFPKLDAVVAINAYVYDGPIAPEEIPPPDEEEPASDGSTAIGSTG
jgi:hypothetical protein